jgi:hypothetical protein
MGAWAARGDTHAGSIASSGVAWSRVRACPQYLWLRVQAIMSVNTCIGRMGDISRGCFAAGDISRGCLA